MGRIIHRVSALESSVRSRDPGLQGCLLQRGCPKTIAPTWLDRPTLLRTVLLFRWRHRSEKMEKLRFAIWTAYRGSAHRHLDVIVRIYDVRLPIALRRG